jgi:hypothetical protein
MKLRWVLYALMVAALLAFLLWLFLGMVILGSVGGLYP